MPKINSDKFVSRDFLTLRTDGAKEGSPLPFLFSDCLNLADDVAKKGGALLVSIDATYSGYLLNHRVYPGVYMADKRSWGSWFATERGGTANYNKPILLHHKQYDGEPIGRVIHASYHRLWADDKRFTDDFKAPATKDSPGSGKIVIQAKITDPDAIIKVLDGRYLTFSSGQSADDAWCSICGVNLCREKPCDHMPGEMYEVELDREAKKKVAVPMYIITGHLTYQEGSFVNIPANRMAKITKAEEIESLVRETVDESTLFAHADHMTHATRDCYARVMLMDKNGHTTDLIRPAGAEDQVSLPSKTVSVLSPLSVVELKAPASAEMPITEKSDGLDHELFALANVARSIMQTAQFGAGEQADRLTSGSYLFFRTITDEQDGHRHILELDVDLVTGKVSGWTSMTSDEAAPHGHYVQMQIEDLNAIKTGVSGNTSDDGVDHTHTFQLHVGKQLNDSVEVASNAEILAAVRMLDDAIRDGTLTDAQLGRLVPFEDDIEILKEHGQDAKLSTAARKKLKASTFCGPGRSFPVPDRAHVTAARRLIGCYRDSAAVKAKIMSCVNSRAKSLGCDTGDDATTGVYASFVKGVKPTMNKPTDQATPPAPPAGDSTAERVQKELIGQIDNLKTQNRELQSLSDSRQNQLEARTKELTDARTELRKSLAQQLALARMITRHRDAENVTNTKAFDALVDGYAARSIDSLQDAIRDNLPDVQRVVETLTDGKTLFSKDRVTPPTAIKPDVTNVPVKDKAKSADSEPDISII